MNQASKIFAVNNIPVFRLQMLNWVNRFSIFCLLDNRQYHGGNPAFECLLGAGSVKRLSVNAGNAFEQFRTFEKSSKRWLFGHFSYDLKNETEQLHSRHPDYIGFPDLQFFEPEIVIRLAGDEVEIFAQDADAVFDAVSNSAFSINDEHASVKINSRFSRAAYTESVNKIKQHILRGDCYEINFCQEFFSKNALINPLAVFKSLTEISPNPFSCLYKADQRYCICASPERYLKKTGSKIVSQPIKGTAKRDKHNSAKDIAAKDFLLHNGKERSENVMVVDLVRNDMSKVCKEGTVKVDELFGIYSFPQVHQMISTISGELAEGTTVAGIVEATFPMGSMTGAPKKKVMELIEQFEKTRRGLFSGAIGYISPAGDFDFNVVIRSIFYNETDQYLSFQTGSAITFYSDAEKEYEECLLKAEAILHVLGSSFVTLSLPKG